MFFLQKSQKSFIICETSSVNIYTDIFDRISHKHFTRLNPGQSFNSLFLNKTKNLIAITSNKVLPLGKECLKIIDIDNKEKNKEISGSLIASSNGISLIENSNKKNQKILLSGCKKYLKDQKNGILISISCFNTSEDSITSKFYDTENFEVYCFCQILLNKEDKDWAKSDYFFVGGFDNDIRQGLIKLYKVYFNENEEKSKLEFIDNIIIENEDKKEIKVIKKKSREEMLKSEIFAINKEINKYSILLIKQNFKGFRGPITSIIQSNINGNIIVSCYDGNVYLFTPPNLDFYLSNGI